MKVKEKYKNLKAEFKILKQDYEELVDSKNQLEEEIALLTCKLLEKKGH